MKPLLLRVVLVAIDTDESSLGILQGARELARAAGAKLHALHVISTEDDGIRTEEATRAERTELLQRLLHDARIASADVECHVLVGEPAHVIRSLSDKIHADVIVVGRHRDATTVRQSLGSTALAVVTNSSAPCLILSSPLRLPLERVLAPIDLSDASRGALVIALSWASALRGAPRTPDPGAHDAVHLTAVFVDTWAESEERQAGPARLLDGTLEPLRREAGTWAGVKIAGAVLAGSDVPQAVSDYAAAHAPDLIVLGTRGLGQDAVGRVGSSALGIAQRMRSPVLLVPPAIWSAYSQHV